MNKLEIFIAYLTGASDNAIRLEKMKELDEKAAKRVPICLPYQYNL